MRRKVLLVEDEDLLRDFMADVLRDLEFEIFESSTAEEALRIISDTEDLGILIADVELAGKMSGLELVQRARSMRPSMRSIIISGRGTPVEASHAGANGFLPKPFTVDMLTEIVSLWRLHE